LRHSLLNILYIGFEELLLTAAHKIHFNRDRMEPSEPPPPYEAAASSSSTSKAAPTHLHPDTAHKERNGIPPLVRRSMEDENRDLPAGWARQYDAKEHHQFFVDTSADPPRSIWHHPYDDEQYLSSVSPEERTRIQSLHKAPTKADIEAESSEDDHHKPSTFPELPPRPTKESGEKRKFGRKLKDKITNSTHEEREAKRKEREEEERRAYEQHQKFRAAMSTAAQTGVPQLLGKDREGKDVYIEPPYGPSGGYGGYSQGAYGYNPYSQGPYANPNARFVRPPDPYDRPYGYGYGGGLGIGAPLLGLGGGLLLGSLLF
jgi:hypothetical protein